MSGLRDGLDEWAMKCGDQVAVHVRSTEEATRGAVKTRRRRRAGAIAGGAVAAVVAVTAIASALPGTTSLEPADNPFQDLGTLACGQDWTLQPGETTYEPDAAQYFDSPSGFWTLTDDDGDTHTGFSGFTAGLGGMSWQGSMNVEGMVVPRATVVAVKEGKIVGSYEGDFQRNSSFDGSALSAFAPYPGQCGDATTITYSGKFTYHLVIQVVEATDGGQPLATIVDPEGDYTVDIDSLDVWGAAHAVPRADLREPQGDTYQAFLVRPTGQSSCRPLQDARADGAPNANSPQYTVSLPGVQPLTNGLWAADPVVISDQSLSGEWYADKAAWLVADDVGEMGEPRFGWTPDGTQLATSQSVGPPGAADCVFMARLDPVTGAVFLVIDGVDWAGFDRDNPGADLNSMTGYQTWVYLGRAE